MNEQSTRQSLKRGHITWAGSTHCDFCRIPLNTTPYFFDAKTHYGRSWAVMCPKCFMEHGIGRIGLGYGQKYDGKTFEKIGG